jgi:hypothetical protein
LAESFSKRKNNSHKKEVIGLFKGIKQPYLMDEISVFFFDYRGQI